MSRHLTTRVERWPLRVPVTITGRTFTETRVIHVRLREGPYEGRGEAAGVYYRGETPEVMAAQIHHLAPMLTAAEFGRDALRGLLPPGGARNALDCALWDLEAQKNGRTVWELAGLTSPRPLLTTVTLGADPPGVVARAAAGFAWARAIKLKLIGDGDDAARVRAARDARPDVWLGIDANQALDFAELNELLPALIAAGVRLIEQPLPAGEDEVLKGFRSPIPLAADESVQCLEDIAALVGRYDLINIKLDKCGGLTEALEMAYEARRLGLGLMVGNMSGTSLATAPALLLGQLCDIVDLDGPVLLACDRVPSVRYRNGMVSQGKQLWGLPRKS